MAAVAAGKVGAPVHRPLAVASGVPRGAGAGVVVDPVLAGAAVQAGVAGALVDVDLTARAGEPGAAVAHSRATVDGAQAACQGGGKRLVLTSVACRKGSAR